MNPLLPGDSERIVSVHAVMLGKPVVRGTWVPVEKVLEQLAARPDLDEVFAIWPELTLEDVKACFAFASQAVAEIGSGHLAVAEDKDAAKLALLRLMEQISEDYWAAGWLSGLEYELWGW